MYLVLFSCILMLQSCFEIVEQVFIKEDGSGTFELVLNMSKSKTKINSIMKMKKVNGHDVPDKEEIAKKINDLEKTIRQAYNGKVDLLNNSEKANSEKLIQQYITKHLSLKADNKNLNLQFIGFESEEGSIWSYFECPGITNLQSLEVNNTILYDFREQQINFIHVKAQGFDETTKLDYPDDYKRFVLKQN